jgi:cytochrome P450
MGHIVAGMVTSGSAMVWTLYEVFRNPKVLATLRAEIAATPAPKTYDDLQQFPYCRAVVNEGLRLYPPVSVIPRMSIKADSFGNYHIPAKTMVLIDLYAMHRNPQYWPDAPTEFKPERFLQKNVILHKYAFIPFSMGKRLCVGNQLAMIQQMLTLMAIVSNFELTFPKIVVPDTSGILNPPIDLRCGCKVRQNF